MTTLTHLQRLEAEAIHIMREVVAECRRPVMLYSIGKDSSVMLRLALKAFHPGVPPFPFLHVDTTWKFREMIAFRDETARRHAHRPEALLGVGPAAGVGVVVGEVRPDLDEQRAEHRGDEGEHLERAFGRRERRPDEHRRHRRGQRPRPGCHQPDVQRTQGLRGNCEKSGLRLDL